MSKLKTDLIEPRVASNVDFGGLDLPSFHGVPLAPSIGATLTGAHAASNPADSDNSTALATTASTRTRAATAVTERLSSASPLMDGSPVAGSSSDVARADHRHPTDTTRATVGSVANLTSAAFFLTNPGLYTSLFTAPQDGWFKILLVGGGGGGGGGGTDLAGQNGGAGVVQSAIMGATQGDVFTFNVGLGGGGASSGSVPASPPNAFDGGASVLRINGTIILNSLGGTRGFSVSSGTLGAPYKTLTYHMHDFGDFAGLRVAINAPAANTPMSKGGHQAMAPGSSADFPDGSSLGEFALAGQPAALNGGDAVYGGGGAGGAPTRVFVPPRSSYADPVHGEGGSGSPTSFGGNGGSGFVYFEFHSTGNSTPFSSPTVNGAAYDSLSFLKQELIALGIGVTP